jgi:hypothetical protein
VERLPAVRVLKQDSLGRVELVELAGRRVIRRVACGGAWPGSRLVAHLLANRERGALLALDGLAGVPQVVDEAAFERAPSLDGRIPLASDVTLRTYVEGTPLHLADALPEDFFERLEDLVGELHARGVCHNDLHKEQNVIVGAGGWPGIVDFQLASVHRIGSRRFASRARDDLRHVAKHRRRYLRFTQRASPLASAPLPPRSALALVWRRTAKPLYNFVTRKLFGYRDGEARRGKEGPWPRWTAPLQAPSTRRP